MATVYFTNNASSGDGSLYNAWANASSGDVIMPDPSVFAAGSTIEILLSNTFSIRGLTLTIDGGACRIILNGQEAYRLGTGTSNDTNNTYINIDFKNFSAPGGSTAATYPCYCSGLGSFTFTNCRFYGNSGASGATSAFIRTTNLPNAVITLNNCVVYNNGSNGTARIIYMAGGYCVLNGCTISGTAQYGNITNNDSLLSSSIDFDAAGFVDAANYDYRLLPTSQYLTGATLTGTDFLGHARAGSLGAYEGSWFVAGAGASVTVNADTIVDYADIGLNAAVTFSGIDRILIVKKELTTAAATLTAAASSNGYFATPNGTSVSALTLTGVIACTYGAAVTAFSGVATSDESATFTIIKTNDLPVLLEKKNDATWATVTTNAATGTTATISGGANVFRVFDGATFYSTTITVAELSTFWRIDNETTIDSTGGDGASAWKVSSWAVDPEIEE